MSTDGDENNENILKLFSVPIFKIQTALFCT